MYKPVRTPAQMRNTLATLRSLSKAPARFNTFKNELASGLLDLENTMETTMESTMARALRYAEQESVAAAQRAYARGDIKQREIAEGVFVMVRS